MSSQEKSYERINQKRRTRKELLRAARELSAKGQQPSVAEVADHAGISRATAYRYFSTPEEMLREAVLDGVADLIDVPDLPDGPAEEATAERLVELTTRIYAMVSDNEPMFRALLSGSVAGKTQQKRAARRVGWLSQTLEPIRARLTPDDFGRLVNGLALVTGIETQVVLKDVCGLEDAEAREAAEWVARTMLAGALANSRSGG